MKMKMHQPLAWIVLALLIALLPRSGWAFEGPEKDRSTKLQEKAAELATTCSDIDKKATSLAQSVEKGIRDALENDIKSALEDVLDDDPNPSDTKNADDAKSYVDAHDIENAIRVAKLISALKKISDDWDGRLKEAAEAKNKEDATKTEVKTRLETVCEAYCKDSDGVTPHIDVCAFRDPNLARVAASVDPASVEQALASMERIERGEATAAEDRGAGGGSVLIPGLSGLTTAEGATELAIRFATALGKLAIDRAKQEAVLWALGEMGTRACGNSGNDTATTREIRTYWLPQLCSLTSEENLQSGFGAGQAMFSALVSAVENDAKGLPGAAAGLIAGYAYWAEDLSDSADRGRSAFACTGMETPSEECERFKEIRLSTAKAVGGLIEGSDPVDEARAWSTAIDEVNRVKPKDSSRYVLVAPLAQLTACGVAVAAELGADDSRRTVIAPHKETIPQMYQVIGALASAPACWTLSGKGWTSADFKCKDEQGEGKCVEALAIDRAGGNDVEKLSTVIRLGSSFKGTQTKAGDAWNKLAQVVARLRGARTRLSKAVDKAGDGNANAKLDAAIAKLADAKLEPNDLRALLDEAKLDEAQDRLSSALDVAEELLAATEAAASLLENVSKPSKIHEDLFPGLLVSTQQKGCNADGKSKQLDGNPGLPAWACTEGKLHDEVVAFKQEIEHVQALIDALRDILAGDWAAGSTKALAAVRELVPHSASVQSLTDPHELVLKELIKELSSSGTKDDKEQANSIETLLNHRPSARTVRRKRSEELATAEYELVQVIRDLKSVVSRETDITKKKALLERIAALETLYRRTTTPTVNTHVGELVGLITAILSAKDSDDIAVVLEKTASPPGSWRRKQVKGAFTASLGSHVGLYTAAEFRWGQYGVNRERGTAHWQAPTLAVPIGFDFAWGTGRNSVGFFVPIIDPAAFVQYDVSENGRLPGPRPLTVLSPGAFFRWGICRTPITLLAGYAYRPRLRTWEATINEPGADAHQIGLSLAIDATFWNIVKR